MSAAILQQHQSEFFDFSDIIYSMQKTRGTSPQQQQQLSNSNPSTTNNNINKSIMKCGARNPQPHPQLHHQLHNCLPAGLNFGLPPPSAKNVHHNGMSFDSNNNSLLMENLDLMNHIGQQQQQQLPPSSPTNSSSSSMSTSSSSSSSNNNNHSHQNGMNTFRAWAQQQPPQQQQPQNMILHNALQRTVSHPHHMVGGGGAHHLAALQQGVVAAPGNHMHLKFADMLEVQQPLNGCGDAAAMPTAAALHRKLERTQSEPLPQQQLNTSRYKTELCRPFEEAGECKYGDKCQFAHGMAELRNLQRHPRYKTELCRTFHSAGYCPYGPRCHFVHNADEVRNNPPPPPAVPSSAAQQQAHNLVSRSTSLQSSAALLANAVAIPTMGNLTLSPAMSMSTGSDRASPTGSLSMSPTNSMVSFFPDGGASFPLSANFPFTNTKISSIIPSPPPSPRDLSPTPMLMGHHHLSSSSSTSSVLSAASSSGGSASAQKGGAAGAAGGMDMGDARLPVFNRLSSTIESAFNTLEI